MGWLFSSRWPTRKVLVEHLRDPSFYGEQAELLRSSVVGNNFWILCRTKESGKTWIGLCLMKGGGRRDPGWGYKSLDETCGPCEVNCPLSFLDQASSADEGYAVEWREKVRAHHAAKKMRPKPAAGLRVRYGDLVFTLKRPASGGARRGWIADGSDGGQYRLKATQIAHAEVVA